MGDKLFSDGKIRLEEGTRLKLGGIDVTLTKPVYAETQLKTRDEVVDALFYSGNAFSNAGNLNYETVRMINGHEVKVGISYHGNGAKMETILGEIPHTVENPPYTSPVLPKPKKKKQKAEKKKAKAKVKAKKKAKAYIYRSAKTGKIVTEKYALKNPDKTVKEQVKE